MRRGIRISLMVFGAVAASGGVLTESSTCSSTGAISVPAAAGCSAGSLPNLAVVTLSASVGIGTFNGSVFVNALSQGNAGSLAQGSISYVEELYTSGPIRPGYMSFFGGGSGIEDDDGFSGGSGGAGIPWAGFSVSHAGCQGDCGSMLIPVELGVEFTLQVGISAQSSAAAVSGGVGGATLGVTLGPVFEADGVTPVSLLEAPETSGGFLCFAGLGLIWTIRRLRNRG